VKLRDVVRGALEVPIVVTMLVGLALVAASSWAMRRTR